MVSDYSKKLQNHLVMVLKRENKQGEDEEEEKKTLANCLSTANSMCK